ncbi:porin [Bradyrhizobium sp. LTSP885]|uniref:porin n=1 Tax=Bradyrhizobium sp. LTSP885 TaxID=1619232 RepID=UPI000AFC673C|nr:porin [Bradyrhizobium sp. LTSP885]
MKKYALTVSAIAIAVVSQPAPASADKLDVVLERLQAIEQSNAQLAKENAALKARLNRVESSKAAAPVVQAAPGRVASAPATGGAPASLKTPVVEVDAQGHTYFEHKHGAPLTFYTPGGEITAYGNLDVSIDDTAKNVGNLNLNGATPPVGNFGWMPAISTNLSYLGVRGFQHLPGMEANFLYQLELGFDVSATPGLKENNSSLSNTVNGAMFNRNTYIGLGSQEWGAVKIGKTDAPYKTSTSAFNPFSGQIGDYSVVMGNTGGDNRVEFGTRLDHAIWYESPTISGFQFNALFAPGQNRDTDSSNIAAGESDCAGGNVPQSGGNLPIACNDGSFSNAYSANLSYTNGPFYATVAYERHQAVNRQSDITAIYGTAALPNAYAQNLFNENVGDEDAFKVGALYRFATRTTVGGIFEMMHRYVPADLQFQNERTRNGTWFFVSQELTDVDSIHFGWAHAFAATGDPGQHNTSTLTTIDGLGTYGPNDNKADMVTASYKRKVSPNFTWYASVAATFNGPSAHYDLGAGGRGVTTDCHDAFGADGGYTSTPHCYAGTTIVGVSTGASWKF